MNLRVLRGVIERRILVNFRVDPEYLQQMLPPPLQPKVVRGVGMAGICLIRLRQIRPSFVPGRLGLRSENAAHRIAVQWGPPEEHHEGVFVPRRDTSSVVNALVGGRLFPGVQHHARFHIQETGERLQVAVRTPSGEPLLEVRAQPAATLNPTSVFKSLGEASRFFERGSIGYSPARVPGMLDGIELHASSWSISPLAVEYVHSAFFQDSARFPAGTVEFDSAMMMREIEHEWRWRESLCAAAFAT